MDNTSTSGFSRNNDDDAETTVSFQNNNYQYNPATNMKNTTKQIQLQPMLSTSSNVANIISKYQKLNTTPDSETMINNPPGSRKTRSKSGGYTTGKLSSGIEVRPVTLPVQVGKVFDSKGGYSPII